MATMGDRPTDQIDTTVASVARVYDYALGGKDNYPVDRVVFERIEATAPSLRPLAVNNRRFLERVVRVLVEEYGVRQFLDHGSGLPTQDNVHEIARRSAPDARVVYVDHDPMVVAHSRELLEGVPDTAVVQADLRDTDAIFGDPRVRKLIDPTEPAAALFVSVLHCIPDSDDPAGLVRRVADRLPPGSFLVVNQLVSEDAALRAWMTEFMAEHTDLGWGRVRQRHEVRRFFEGLEVLPPGLVEISTWRPDSALAPRQLTDEWIEFGGVARSD